MKVVSRFPIEARRLEAWRARFPTVTFVVCDGDEGEVSAHHDAQVLLGGWSASAGLLAKLPQLRWIQATFTGVEAFLSPELAARGIALTNFRGVSAPNIAEHVVACMLAFARGLPELMRRQARKEWLPYGQEPPTFELNGQRLGLVGFGEIAHRVACVCKRGFNMEVWATRRAFQGALPEEVDRVLPPSALQEMLAWSDHVVLAAALTPETRGVIGAAALAVMKPTTYLYNVGRGELIDQDDLLGALATGRLAGAALDVTSPEPLPPQSPLWDLPNVLVTAHTSGPTRHYWDRGDALFLDNLERFLAGRPLRNTVDIALGY